MSTNINVEQNANLASKNAQLIAEQNNYYGITLSDALDLARKVSDEQYSKIKPELISELNNKFDREFEKRFEEELNKRTATDEEFQAMLNDVFNNINNS